MMVGLQIFIEKEEMVLDSNFWCGCPGNIQNQCFFNKSLPDLATGGKRLRDATIVVQTRVFSFVIKKR